jgi:hypothetical protein
MQRIEKDECLNKKKYRERERGGGGRERKIQRLSGRERERDVKSKI